MERKRRTAVCPAMKRASRTSQGPDQSLSSSVPSSGLSIKSAARPPPRAPLPRPQLPQASQKLQVGLRRRPMTSARGSHHMAVRTSPSCHRRCHQSAEDRAVPRGGMLVLEIRDGRGGCQLGLEMETREPSGAPETPSATTPGDRDASRLRHHHPRAPPRLARPLLLA